MQLSTLFAITLAAVAAAAPTEQKGDKSTTPATVPAPAGDVLTAPDDDNGTMTVMWDFVGTAMQNSDKSIYNLYVTGGCQTVNVMCNAAVIRKDFRCRFYRYEQPGRKSQNKKTVLTQKY